MLKPRFVAWIIAMAVLGVRMASAEDFPSKPLRILAGEAGGGNDLVSRLIAQGLIGSLGQQVIVDNRPTNLAVQLVSQAQPDGYTMLFISNSMWIAPLIEKLPYDPVKDFSPVTFAMTSPSILIVNPSVPAKSAKELIELARAKPGQLNYASSVTGTNSHLAAELFKSMAGVNIVRVAFKGGTLGVNAVVAGEVQMMIVTSSAPITQLVKAGKLRALAVSDAKRSALLPDLPTIAETALPGYASVPMAGIFVPAKTPTAIINKLNREIVRTLTKPDVKEKLANGGAEVVASSPQEFAAAIKNDMAINGKLIKEVGIKAGD